MKLTRFVWLIFIGLIGFAGYGRWQNLSEEPLIMTDGQGYYAYLPAVFIYHDLQFSFVDQINETYYPEGKRANYVVPSASGNVNKYFMGTAVAQAPFFLVGCAMSALVGAPIDGYSWPFQLTVGLAAIFYLCFGLLLLGRLLVNIGFGNSTSQLTMLLILFGTNLFYYSIYEPSMSHVYSFFSVSAFLFFVQQAMMQFTAKSVGFAAAAFGLTVLVRPTNALVILGVPAISSGLLGTLTLVENIFSNRKALLLSFIAVAVVALQPLTYLIQTGSPVVWSYSGEGFDFSSPEFFNVLFSYRKGLFVYCPALLLALIGIAAAYRRNKGRYGWLLFFLFVNTWVISSWWMWFYGGSYGHRAFIDLYPFFAIGIAAALHRGFGPIGSRALAIIAMLFIPLQLVQTYQYNKHIIPFDNMSKAKFWNLFLRTGNDLAWYYSGYEGEDAYVGLDSLVVSHSMEQEMGWGNEQQFTGTEQHEGARSAVMLPADEYGITMRKNYSELGVDRNVIRVSAWVNADSRTTNIGFVCSLEDSTGNSYYWKKYPLRPQFSGRNEWSRATAVFKCGNPRNASDRVVVYPMKSDDATVFLDEMEVSFIRAR